MAAAVLMFAVGLGASSGGVVAALVATNERRAVVVAAAAAGAAVGRLAWWLSWVGAAVAIATNVERKKPQKARESVARPISPSCFL
jgi:hypothetical protein